MSFGKYALGLFLITLSASVSAKTFREYYNEAEAQAPACKLWSNELNKVVKSRSNPRFADVVTAGIVGDDIRPNANLSVDQINDLYVRQNIELDKLKSKCNDAIREILPAEARAIGRAEAKARFEEDLKEGRVNPDGSRREPPWYKTLSRDFKTGMLNFMETLGDILIWPAMIMTLLLSLLFVFDTKGFVKLMFGMLRGVIRLVAKKAPTKLDSNNTSKS